MRKTRFLAILAIVAVLSGCVQSGPRCSAPYMEYGDMGYCCLDANQNSVCDKYEKGVASTIKAEPSTAPSSTPTSMP